MSKAYLEATPTTQLTPAHTAQGATVSTPHTRKHNDAEGAAIALFGLGAIGFGLWELWKGGQSSVTPPPITTTTPPGCGQPVGTLVVDPNGTVYVVDQNGDLDPVPDKTTFNACGYDASDVVAITSDQLSACSIGPDVSSSACPPGPLGPGYPSPNCLMGGGLLAKVAGNPAIWITDCGTGPGGQGCQTHLIPNMTVFDACGYNGQKIYPVLQAILDATPQGADITSSTCIPLYSCGSGGGRGGGAGHVYSAAMSSGRSKRHHGSPRVGMGGGTQATRIPPKLVPWGYYGRYPTPDYRAHVRQQFPGSPVTHQGAVIGLGGGAAHTAPRPAVQHRRRH